MVNTVGSKGKPGEHVRGIVSVNMLSEGWDVKSVTHILGLRAFGSPLLTEQIVGRGLRRTNYDALNQPLEERPEGSEETVDAFGIPFVGFPVEKRKRPKTGEWGQKSVWIEADPKKAKYRVQVPNVRSWASRRCRSSARRNGSRCVSTSFKSALPVLVERLLPAPHLEVTGVKWIRIWLDSANLRRFQWTGLVAEGKRCRANKVPCHTDLEKRFADFLDGAKDVVRYFKNERLGFSVTY